MTKKNKRCGALLLLILSLGCLTGWFVGKTAEDNAKNLLAMRMIDSMEALKYAEEDNKVILKTYEQNALAACKNLARLLELKKKQGAGDLEELLGQFCKDFCLAEYSISNEKGIVEYCNHRDSIGYDMGSKEQSRAFMAAIHQPDFELVQSPQPRGDNGEWFQYIGVSRRDAPGIVQIGYPPFHYENIYSVGAIQRRLQMMRIGEDGFVILVKDNHIIAAEDPRLIGEPVSVPEKEKRSPGDFFHLKMRRRKWLATYEMLGDLAIIGMIPEDEYQRLRAPFFVFFLGTLASVCWFVKSEGRDGN